MAKPPDTTALTVKSAEAFRSRVKSKVKDGSSHRSVDEVLFYFRLSVGCFVSEVGGYESGGYEVYL
jgi:hypothetical protein